MDSKSLLTIVITALITGGGVYLWQNQNSELPQQLSTETIITEEKASDSSQTTDIVELAKNSSSSFLYLVSSPNNKETSVVLKDGNKKFAFTYPYNDWRKLNFAQPIDPTATDGAGGLFEPEQWAIYEFCQDTCDRETQKGKGFQMIVWNANYPGRNNNPNFYQKNGEFFVTESNDFIITYKPYQSYANYPPSYVSSNNEEIAKAAADLFESFKIIK